VKTVERIKIKVGKLKDKEYKMVLTPSGYVPRDPTYPLTEEGKVKETDCTKLPKEVKGKW